MKQEQLKFQDLDEYIEESLAFIRANVPEGETAFVGFSGGKDSIVIAWLMARSGVDHELYYSNTTIDPPEVVKFIKREYPHCKWLRPKRSFLKMLGGKNPPIFHCRWCCEELKKKPSWKLPHYYRVFGVRSEESNRRAKYPRVNLMKANKGGRKEQLHLYPILDWPEWAVWELIERESLAVPSLYEHFDRLGCMLCPMRTKKEHDKWQALYSGFYKAFEHAVTRWFNKRKATGRTMNNDTAEGFINDWYNQKARWYDGRKGKK